MTKILCVIPARLQSTRLPRKPLIEIKGKPMIQWTYEAAKSCKDFHEVIVATDSTEVSSVIEKINGKVELTPSSLETGSDRVAYVAEKYTQYDVIVNLQGDEPFVTSEMLSALIQPYIEGEDISMSTLAAPLDFELDYNDPNTVKVIYDKNFDAIYFSRSPIPYFRSMNSFMPSDQQKEADKAENIPIGMHLGLYAYKRNFLLEYTKMSQTPLEKTELLEQLRVLENGHKIRVCFTDKRVIEINTPEDLQKALQL